MLILTIRTDKPESELGLYDDSQQIGYIVWEAHRQLAETIHQKMNELVKGQGKLLEDIEGIVAYKGPGSFTGLRIGLSVANALAYGLSIPIVGTQDVWIERGIKRLVAGESDTAVLPEYGAPAHITAPKH